MGLYYNEAELAPHRDNNQCEYTMSIQVHARAHACAHARAHTRAHTFVLQVDMQPETVRYPIFVCEETTPRGNWRELCHSVRFDSADNLYCDVIAWPCGLHGDECHAACRRRGRPHIITRTAC